MMLIESKRSNLPQKIKNDEGAFATENKNGEGADRICDKVNNNIATKEEHNIDRNLKEEDDIDSNSKVKEDDNSIDNDRYNKNNDNNNFDLSSDESTAKDSEIKDEVETGNRQYNSNN